MALSPIRSTLDPKLSPLAAFDAVNIFVSFQLVPSYSNIYADPVELAKLLEPTINLLLSKLTELPNLLNLLKLEAFRRCVSIQLSCHCAMHSGLGSAGHASSQK
jgi:hypothetical protein